VSLERQGRSSGSSSGSSRSSVVVVVVVVVVRVTGTARSPRAAERRYRRLGFSATG